MARGGDPSLTWIEDKIIVAALRVPDLPKGSLDDFAAMRSFLERKFPDRAGGIIEEFIKTVNRVRTDYVLLLVLGKKGLEPSRTSVRKKYYRLAITLRDFQKAVISSIGQPWELIRRGTCRGKPDQSEITRAKYEALDFHRFNEQLLSIMDATSNIIRCLKGTAQDRTRPERFMVHELWSKWIELGFPEPRLVRGADAHDAAAPDEDPFVETVRFVFDTIYADSKVVDGEVTYQLRAVIEAGSKKLRARK